MGDNLTIRRSGKLHPARLEFRAELRSIDEIPIVGQGERSPRGRDDEGLRVLQTHRAHRGVAHVSDGQRPGEPRDPVCIEHLEHQAHAAMVPETYAVACGDARALLAAMLQ